MSYNITAWKTKSIKDLIIPLQEIKNLPYVIIDRDDDRINASGTAELFELIGSLKGRDVYVDSIEYFSEGSGHQWDNFKAMLSKSTGELIASQVWEGGDSITMLTVKDGNVTEETIDL